MFSELPASAPVPKNSSHPPVCLFRSGSSSVVRNVPAPVAILAPVLVSTFARADAPPAVAVAFDAVSAAVVMALPAVHALMIVRLATTLLSFPAMDAIFVTSQNPKMAFSALITSSWFLIIHSIVSAIAWKILPTPLTYGLSLSFRLLPIWLSVATAASIAAATSWAKPSTSSVSFSSAACRSSSLSAFMKSARASSPPITWACSVSVVVPNPSANRSFRASHFASISYICRDISLNISSPSLVSPYPVSSPLNVPSPSRMSSQALSRSSTVVLFFSPKMASVIGVMSSPCLYFSYSRSIASVAYFHWSL